MTISRRAALISALCAAAVRPAFSASALEAGLMVLQRSSGGRLGVYALDTGSKRPLIRINEHERFAMCSTFKLPLAAAILAKVDAKTLQLDQRVPYTQADLLSYAPVATARLAEGSMAVHDLCAAAVEVSDNTAANLLLSLVDGPHGLTQWLRSIGDDITRLDRTEPELNTNIAGDERDTTTPHAMAETFHRLLTETVLTAESRELLAQWLEAATPGRKRIRAGLPQSWRVGDKTGTGANGAVNDVAIAWPQDRAPIVVAVYMSESQRPTAELESFHARVGALLQ
jgi:beta-lactamase class A